MYVTQNNTKENNSVPTWDFLPAVDVCHYQVSTVSMLCTDY